MHKLLLTYFSRSVRNIRYMSLNFPGNQLYRQNVQHLYIGRIASIYPMCCIYISNTLYLYIQRHRHIDAKRTEKRKTFKTSNADDLTHTPEIPDAPPLAGKILRKYPELLQEAFREIRRRIEPDHITDFIDTALTFFQ